MNNLKISKPPFTTIMEDVLKKIAEEVGFDIEKIIERIEKEYNVKIGKGNRNNIEKLLKSLKD